MSGLDKILKSPGARKRPILVSNMEDIVQAAENFHGGKYDFINYILMQFNLPLIIRVCPIFQVSNVVGTNLDLLRKFLNLIPVSRPDHENESAEFQIDDVYWVIILNICYFFSHFYVFFR
jgi:hypothetical protein